MNQQAAVCDSLWQIYFMEKLKQILSKHSLSLVLISIFILQSVLGGYFYHNTWVSEQQVHHQPIQTSAFWNDFMGEYMISVLADTYGAVLLVLLTKKLYEIGSQESKASRSTS